MRKKTTEELSASSTPLDISRRPNDLKRSPEPTTGRFASLQGPEILGFQKLRSAYRPRRVTRLPAKNQQNYHQYEAQPSAKLSSVPENNSSLKPPGENTPRGSALPRITTTTGEVVPCGNASPAIGELLAAVFCQKKRKKTIMYQSLRFTRRLLPRPVFQRNYYIRTVIQLSFAKYNLSCTLYLRSKRRRFFYDKKGTFVLPHPLHLLTTSELSLVEIKYQFVYFTLLQ